MAGADFQGSLNRAFERVEEAILPSLPAMLDSLLDAASLARPGADAEKYATDLRALAAELANITVQIEAVSCAGKPLYATASAA